MRIEQSKRLEMPGFSTLCTFRRVMLVLAGCVILQLVGCVNIPKQAFNRETHKDILEIGLLEPPATVEYAVANLGHPGLGFGLIGGLIAAADIQSKTDEFTKRMKSRNFDVRVECQSALTAELAQAGYKIVPVAAQREAKGFVQSYESINSGADAYLDVVCSAGYLSAGPASPYVPTVMINARMVKRVTREIIYQDIMSYGYENRFLQAVSIAADTKYNFSDFTALTQNDERALEGLRKGIPVLAKRLVQDLGGVRVVTGSTVQPAVAPNIDTPASEPKARPSGVPDQPAVTPTPP